MQSLRIFLSSTDLDLGETRRTIAKFLGVLRTDVASMEFFGSDERQPKVVSLENVRQCNVFVGIYAARYGTVDSETGLSITELEYKEAIKVLKSGKLIALLPYVISPSASWPLNLIEESDDSRQKLAAFKGELAEEHTVTFFIDKNELPFQVLRDVVRKTTAHRAASWAPRSAPIPEAADRLLRPLGMEHYTEQLREFFYGRSTDTASVVSQLVAHRFSLLIGDSGVGKTSLLNAGVLPRCRELGWRVAMTRPLSDPLHQIKAAAWDQLMAQAGPPALDVPTTLSVIADAHRPAQVLLVIDQFEDILTVPDQLPEVVNALCRLSGALSPNLRVLVCYRGDVEAQIGSVWQAVSGAADGLPRTYLGPLSEGGARDVLRSTLIALELPVTRHGERPDQLYVTVIRDLATESAAAGYRGIYPPFLQMVMLHLASASSKDSSLTQRYATAGRSQGIVGEFLLSQLAFLGDDTFQAKRILIALVSSYGTKDQKTPDELSQETGVDQSITARVLRSLVNLRLVRLAGGQYEIVHDFLARMVLTQLASNEEREAKKFKTVLAASAAAFTDTNSVLTVAESLYLYKHRNQIITSEVEARLLVATHLAGNGPLFYWIQSIPREQLVDWIRSHASADDPQVKRNALALLVRFGQHVPVAELAREWAGYTRGRKLAALVRVGARRSDMPTLLKLLRSHAPEVGPAAEDVLVDLLTTDDHEVLAALGRSRSEANRGLFDRFAKKHAETDGRGAAVRMMAASSGWQRLLGVLSLGYCGNSADIGELERLAEKGRSRVIRGGATRSLVRLISQSRRKDAIMAHIEVARSRSLHHEALQGLHSVAKSRVTARDLLGLCRNPSSAWDGEWDEISYAALHVAYPKDRVALRRQLRKWTDLARPEFGPPPTFALENVLLALARIGKPQDFDFILRRIGGTDEVLRMIQAHLVCEEIAKLATRRSWAVVRRYMSSPEFWKYFRADTRGKSLIPIMQFENLHLLKRIVGIAYCHIAGRKQLPTLLKLLDHSYWSIARAARAAIVRVGRAEDVPRIVDSVLSLRSRAGDDYESQPLLAVSDLDEALYGGIFSTH